MGSGVASTCKLAGLCAKVRLASSPDMDCIYKLTSELTSA